ncbi:putative metal-binding protein [Klebsiella pneumoniae]|nr:putative metal-binding protein [Klebsiella pneumoniae]
MSSIHGHEVLQMMLASGESWTVASLEAAIRRRFGEEARFHTCSAENLSAAQLVAFLEKKGKFIAREEGGSYCAVKAFMLITSACTVFTTLTGWA